MDIKKEMKLTKEMLINKKECAIGKICLKQKLCTNSAFRILKKASEQSEKKMETIFLEEMIKNISDSTWFLTNGKSIHPKGYKHIDKRYKEEDNLPYSFVVLGMNLKTKNLKNLYEITFKEEKGKIFQDSFKIENSKTGESIINIKNIK